MRQLSAKPILTLSHFTTRTQNFFQKSHILPFSTDSHQNPFPSHQSRRPTAEDSRNVRVSVWWDFENCNLPLNTNVFRVSQSIFNAVRANGMKGPLQITAFGDIMQISRTNQQALSSNGITLIHVPSGGKNSADRSLLIHLMSWVSRNPPPAHIFLISGDSDFSDILHRLRMENYNILLASPDTAPSVLCSAATIMWQWSSLLKGENLTGKLFNQPPDGPFNSCYGHYRAPLEDPFASTEQNPCLTTSADEPKIRPIPKAVSKLVSQILDSFPDGISMSLLRTELSKSNLAIDKDLYGHKKFSRFLQAMPSVLKLHSGSDGKCTVKRLGNNKCLDEHVSSAYAESDIGSDESSCIDNVTEKSIIPPALEPKSLSANFFEARKEENQNDLYSTTVVQETKTNAPHPVNSQEKKKEEKWKEIITRRTAQEVREQDKKVKISEQPEKVVGDEIKEFPVKNENQVPVVNNSELGIMRRIWIVLFGSGDEDSNRENFQKNGGKDTTCDKAINWNQPYELVRPALFSPSSHEALIYRKNAGPCDVDVADVSSQDASLFNQIMSWFKFSSSKENDNKFEKGGETAATMKVDANQLEIFSRESFWKELESFIDTPEGVASISLSRNRDKLAQNLQKQGPPSLQSLSKTELLHLVDLLISHKKWVEECSSRTYPFQLTRPPAMNNGLSQIFSAKHPSPPEPGERKHQNNPPHTGVSPQHTVHKNLSTKTRSELLADCQKLVDHIVKEYPEGFNLGSFRKLFLERNGYRLHLQKLGYEKLVNLLQIMPGVKIESNLIFPAGPFKRPSPPQKSSGSKKDNDSDSSWDELGPVDDSISGRNKGKSGHGYDPVRDEDFSDSEDEELGNEAKPKPEEESSLLQILDTWYGNKGCDGKKGEPAGPDVSADGGGPNTKSLGGQTGPGLRSENQDVGPTKKYKPSKSYSFVSEQQPKQQQQHVDSKDELVEGILVSLKKSGERSNVESRVFG
ncbi:Putative endonuclease or glycosyl hydrolase [Striga hermonthica]|uniref:Endonuclease or glycosyl hydrolase n=1 Tax=Striga hermonthica TaxID=68872 RepID=A0A9N7RQ34_STRHE|nr:Putative endonuclease or glycosyl hydrolase [Striga hermonthica]